MKRDDIPALNETYAITNSMIIGRANAHSKREGAIFYLDAQSLIDFARELIAGAQGEPWPLTPMLPWHCPNHGQLLLERAKKHRPGTPLPDATGDTLRLNMLEHVGGFVRGSDGGRESYRIFGYETWHPTLRAAIDKLPSAKRAPFLKC